MARIRSGDGVPSRTGRRLNVAIFSQKEVLVRLAVGRSDYRIAVVVVCSQLHRT